MYIKQTPISARNKQSVDSSKKVYQIQDFPDGAIKLLEQVVPDETRGRIACVPLQILFICISSGFDQEEDMETLVVDTSTRPDLVLHNNRKKKG